ncbi:MAG: TetR/AcrR family transcriptional regulator [Amphiplicatus sp.]
MTSLASLEKKGAELSRRERKKLETRLKILDAALTLMAERGYDGVRVEEICEQADVANATFFLHFRTKAALISAFNEQVSQKIAERLEGFNLPAIDKLELLRALMLDEWSRHSELLRAIVKEAAAQDAASLADSSSSLVSLVSQIVAEGQQSGEFTTEFEVALVAQCLISTWRATTLQWAVTGDARAARRANRQALDLVLNGVLSRPTQAVV